MREEQIIPQLLSLGFKDKSSINNTHLDLDVSDFTLEYEKGKFKLIGNGGYDDAGEMELGHLQIEDIKPLYKLLTGETLKEIEVVFNYQEWQEKLKKDEEQRVERREQYFKDNPWYAEMIASYPKNEEVGFLDMMAKVSSANQVNGTTIVWHEEPMIKKEDTL
jgi:hypothetical protein